MLPGWLFCFPYCTGCWPTVFFTIRALSPGKSAACATGMLLLPEAQQLEEEETDREADFVLHTATPHKPHAATHSRQEFVDTNISGTLKLLEAFVKSGIKGFIYTSTTSTFGDRLRPPENEPAIWVAEDLPPVPKISTA